MIPTLGMLMSLNDPQWGGDNDNKNNPGNRRPNQGPPDLDELWRDFQRRLSGLLNKNGGGGSGGPRMPAGD
ncbi:MAG: hypothetical protein RIR00_631, partial [Pseudomonadota bacterium]